MPPPSTLAAVTVAPATGSLAEFVTIPTIAPEDTLTADAENSSALLAGSADQVATEITRPCRYFRMFIYFAPRPNFSNRIYGSKQHRRACNTRSSRLPRGDVNTFDH